MPGFVEYGLWGAAGAFVYATNALILALWNDGATQRGRGKALAEYAVSILTGVIFAAAGAEILSGIIATGITINGFALRMDVNPIAAALTVGWSSNYLWPRILRKLGNSVDSFGTGKAQ